MSDQQGETSVCSMCGESDNFTRWLDTARSRRRSEGHPTTTLCDACSRARSAEAEAREGEYWDVRAAREGGWPPRPPHPAPSYEPLMFIIDGHTVNILDGCDCKRFLDWGNCRHYEVAMEQHRSATERP
jgi:hypothetical protein